MKKTENKKLYTVLFEAEYDFNECNDLLYFFNSNHSFMDIRKRINLQKEKKIIVRNTDKKMLNYSLNTETIKSESGFFNYLEEPEDLITLVNDLIQKIDIILQKDEYHTNVSFIIEDLKFVKIKQNLLLNQLDKNTIKKLNETIKKSISVETENKDTKVILEWILTN